MTPAPPPLTVPALALPLGHDPPALASGPLTVDTGARLAPHVLASSGTQSLCGPLLSPQDRASRCTRPPEPIRGARGSAASPTPAPPGPAGQPAPSGALGLPGSTWFSVLTALLTLRGCSLHAGHAQSSPSAARRQGHPARTQRLRAAQEASHEGPSPPAAHHTHATPHAASRGVCWLFSEILRPNLSLGSQVPLKASGVSLTSVSSER